MQDHFKEQRRLGKDPNEQLNYSATELTGWQCRYRPAGLR